MPCATRLAVYGDPHGAFSDANAYRQKHPDVPLVVVGDMFGSTPPSTPFWSLLPGAWWIPGNHDFDSNLHYDALYSPPSIAGNLHARAVDLGGLRVAGLGGHFQGRVWYPKTSDSPRHSARDGYIETLPRQARWRAGDITDPWRGLPLRERAAIWKEDVDSLSGQRADILITHEAPSCHPHGFSALDQLAMAMGVKLLVHGHHHCAYEAWLPSGVRVIGLAAAELLEIPWPLPEVAIRSTTPGKM